MLTRATLLRSTAAVTGTLLVGRVLGAGEPAVAQTTQEVTIAGARKVLADLRQDKAFGNARTLLRKARAVLIVPRLIKGGFIVGGEGGNGVLMVRRKGSWSEPAFYVIGAASFGLQIGLEQAEVILLVMSERGVNGLLHDQFKIGAQAGITAVTFGSNVEGALAGPNPPDIVVWSSSSGLYGGLTVDGSIVKSQPNLDAEYYGQRLSTRDILYGELSTPRAVGLRRDMNALG
ncbi:MAG: lipid-binding SYLF domain-containing protein [Acetobacteraceae bacterium]